MIFVGKDLHGLDVEALDQRLEKLERRVYVEEGYLPPELNTLKNRIEKFKTKLEVDYFSICCGLLFPWF